jgi:hypothetical protein
MQSAVEHNVNSFFSTEFVGNNFFSPINIWRNEEMHVGFLLLLVSRSHIQRKNT